MPDNNEFDLSALESQDFDLSAIEQDFDLSALDNEDYQAPLREEEAGGFKKAWGTVKTTFNNAATSLAATMASIPGAAKGFAAYGAAQDTSPEGVKRMQELIAKPNNYFQAEAYKGALEVMNNTADLPRLNQDFITAAKEGDIGGLLEATAGALIDLPLQALMAKITFGGSMFTQGIGLTYMDAIEQKIAKGESVEEAVDDFGAIASSWIAGSLIGVAEKLGMDKVFGEGIGANLKQKLSRIIGSLITEGSTEFFQEYFQMIGAAAGDKGQRLKAMMDSVKSNPQGFLNALNAGIAGMVGGGGMKTLQQAFGTPEEATAQTPSGSVEIKGPGAKVVAAKIASVTEKKQAIDEVASVSKVAPEYTEEEQAIDKEAATIEKALDPDGFNDAEQAFAKKLEEAAAKAEEKADKAKQKKDAVQKPEPAPVDVREQPQDGAKVGEGDAQGQVTPQEGAQVAVEEKKVEAPKVQAVVEKEPAKKPQKKVATPEVLQRIKTLRTSGMKVFPNTKDNGTMEDFEPTKEDDPFNGADFKNLGKAVRALRKAGYTLTAPLRSALVRTKSGQIVINPDMVRDIQPDDDFESIESQRSLYDGMTDKQASQFGEAFTPAQEKTKSSFRKATDDVDVEDLNPYFLNKIANEPGNPRAAAAKAEIQRRAEAKQAVKAKEREARQKEEREIQEQERVRREKEREAKDKERAKAREEKEQLQKEKEDLAEKKRAKKEEERLKQEEEKAEEARIAEMESKEKKAEKEKQEEGAKTADEVIEEEVEKQVKKKGKTKGATEADIDKMRADVEAGKMTEAEMIKKLGGEKEYKRRFLQARNARQTAIQNAFNLAKNWGGEKRRAALLEEVGKLIEVYARYGKKISQAQIDNYINFGNIAGVDKFKASLKIERDDDDEGGDYGVMAITPTSYDLRPDQTIPISRMINKWIGHTRDALAFVTSKVQEVSGEELMRIATRDKKYGKINQVVLSGLMKMSKLLGYEVRFYTADGLFSLTQRKTAGGYQQYEGNKIAIVLNTRESDEWLSSSFLHEAIHGMTNHLIRRFADEYKDGVLMVHSVEDIIKESGLPRNDAEHIHKFLNKIASIYLDAKESWLESVDKVAIYISEHDTDDDVDSFLTPKTTAEKEKDLVGIIVKAMGISPEQASAMAPHILRALTSRTEYTPYILTRVDELLAGVAHPQDASLLAALPVRSKLGAKFAEAKRKVVTVFDQILETSKEFIRQFLGIDVDIDIVKEHWNSALNELHNALVELEENVFGDLLTQTQEAQKIPGIKEVFATANEEIAASIQLNEGSKPKIRPNIVKTLTSYMARAKVSSIAELQAFVDKINNSGKMGANHITQAEVERAYELRNKQVERNKERKEKAAEERIKKAISDELSMDVKDRLIKVISDEMRNFSTYNRRDIRKILDTIKGEKDPSKFAQHAEEAIRVLRGIEYQKQLQKARAIQRSIKFKESIPINEKGLFRDVRGMDLEVLSSEQLDRFIHLAENIQKNAVDTSSVVSGFNNSSLHGLLSMKEFVAEYKRAENDKMNAANSEIGDGDFMGLLAEDQQGQAEATLKAKKASAKEERERTALYKIMGLVYRRMRQSGVIDAWTEGRSRQFKATVDKFFDILSPKDNRVSSISKMSLKDLRRLIQSLEYFERYGELTNFAGQSIVFDQAARRVSLSLNNERVKGKIRQLNSVKDIFDARTPTQLVEFAAKMIKDVRNALNEMFFANLKMLDAQVHEQHRQVMTRIHEKARELKLDESNLVRIQLFSNIFATKTNPNIDGKAAYLAEVRGNIKKYGKALSNKMKAAKEESHPSLTVADVEREMKIYDELVKVIEENGKAAALSAQEHEFRNLILEELNQLKPEFRQSTIAFSGKEWQEWFEYVPTKAIGSVSTDQVKVDANLENLMKLMEFDPKTTKLPDYESTHARERSTTVGGAYYENNIINSMNSYVLRALYDTHVLPEIMTLNHVVNNKRVLEDVGKQNVDVIKGSLQKAVRRGRGEYVERSRVVNALETMKNVYVTGKLGNVWQLANQLLSMMPAIAIMHPKGFKKALQVMMNPSSIDWGDPNIKNFSDWIKVHGHGLQNRDATFERFQSIEDYNAWKQSYQRWNQKMMDKNTWVLRKADAWSAALTFLSSYLGSGGTFANPDFNKMASAEADTDLIQNASNPRFASSLFRPDSQEARLLVSFAYTFKSFAVNQSLTSLGAIRNLNTPRGKRILAASVSNIILYQMMVIAVANVLNGLTGAAAQLVLEDDDWEKLRQKMRTRNENRRKNLLEKLIWRSASDIFLAWMPEILESSIQNWGIENLRKFINDKVLLRYEKAEPVFFNKEKPGGLANGYGGYSGPLEMMEDMADVGGIAWKIYNGDELEDYEVVIGLMQATSAAVTYAPFVPFRGDAVKVINNLTSVLRTEAATGTAAEERKKRVAERKKIKKHQKEAAEIKKRRGVHNFFN